jgi:predicted Zn-dependent protease
MQVRKPTFCLTFPWERLSAGEDTKNTRKKLRDLEAKDVNTVYGLELEKIDLAIDEYRLDDAEKYAARAADARSHLAVVTVQLGRIMGR